MRKAVRPGQVTKWPQLMAQRNIDMMGLKTVPWRNTPRSYFVGCTVLELYALCMWVLFLVVGRVLGGASGMFHRPLVLLRWILMMIFPFYDADIIFCEY